MKKIFFAAVTMVMMSVNAMANEQPIQEKKFTNEVCVESLTRHLGLNIMQAEEVAGIQQYFNAQLERAARIKGVRRTQRTNTAVMEHLKLMHDILSPKQYRMYLTTLNLTFENRGLKQYIG